MRSRPIEKFKIVEGMIASPSDAIHKFLNPVSVNINDVSDPSIPNSVNIGLLQNIKKISGTGNSNIFLNSNKIENSFAAAFPIGFRNDYAVGRTIIINWDNSRTLGTYQIKDAKQNVYYVQDGKVINTDNKIIEDTSPAQLSEVQRARIYGITH